MRIDPARHMEAEIGDLRKQIAELQQQCEKYFMLIEEIRSGRSGWKQQRTGNRYGSRF
jgi:hypothetical protein